MAATGLALWPHLSVFRPLARLFGGRNDVAIWHAGFGLELVIFFAGHMAMVATTGLRNNIRAIVTGWYRLPAVPLLQRSDNLGTAGAVGNDDFHETRTESRVPAQRHIEMGLRPFKRPFVEHFAVAREKD